MQVEALISRDPAKLDTLEKSQLIQLIRNHNNIKNEWLRRAILDHNRIDLLATEVLGYQVQPFHLKMMQWQFLHPESMQLVFRGAGKSTTCTITKAVHLLLKNPNLRILIASKSQQNAEGFLKEIKGHFEGNEKLTELFGEYYDSRKVVKWDTREIEVALRTENHKEASITCVGVAGTIVSKHYDVILSDDLVDEENARTKGQREKTLKWYYQTLDPTLEPPSSDVPHRGEHHRLGTRYNFDDLWGHLMANELKEHTQIIPALDENDNSPWPDKYPPRWFKEKRRKSGVIIFNAQYQNNTEAMKGEVFQYDDCQFVEDNEIPSDLKIFQGIDLAIKTKESNDQFAHVTIGVDDQWRIFVLDFFAGHIRFMKQTEKIQELYRKYDPIRVGIETNAYQDAQFQKLKDEDGDIRLVPMITSKDKMTRAWKLSAEFEDKRVFFKKGMSKMIDQVVLFPSHRYDDLFDALEMAVQVAKQRVKKKRRREPGLLGGSSHGY
jgi:predicted phage terminase large subunit-like protein